MYTLGGGVYMVIGFVWYLQRIVTDITDWESAFIERSEELYEETVLSALYENHSG